MNGISLDAMEFSMSSLDMLDEQMIISIAEQCPYDGGEAVYQARAFAALSNLSLTIDAVDNCSSSKILIVESPPEITRIIVYPNPAEDHFKYISRTNPVTEISIVDINGKIVFTESVSSKTGTAGTIKLPELVSGTYAVMFKLTDGLPVTEKIIIR